MIARPTTGALSVNDVAISSASLPLSIWRSMRPTRKMQSDEPDWIGRMRKICLHVRAIDGWEIGPGVEHVMATEVRAAYQQLDVVWKYVPATIRLEDLDREWADQARNGLLPLYDHPTPQSLMLPAGGEAVSATARTAWFTRSL